MTIKENIEQIKNNLDSSYSKLQELKYEEEIENYVRASLIDILSFSGNLLNSINREKTIQKNIKRQGRKG